MNELKIIDERIVLGKEFRIYGTVEEPLFLAKEVAEWIDYSKDSKGNYRLYKMMEMVDEDEKTKEIVECLNGGVTSKARNTQEMWFLTEDGLYEILMQSRKPIAKQFKKEVKVILKSIRKNGGYIIGQESMDEKELLSKALIVANNIAAENEKKIQELEFKLDQSTPLIEFANIVTNSEKCVDMKTFAKLLSDDGINIGRTRLFKLLRDNYYLMHDNTPYQKYINNGYFRLVSTTRGYDYFNQTLVTGKGQVELSKKIRRIIDGSSNL